jgi:hypothetical protein
MIIKARSFRRVERVPECPECRKERYTVDLSSAINGMVIRHCVCGHDWVDEMTTKEASYLAKPAS